MISSYATLPDLVIPNGASVSQVFNGVYVYHDATGIELYSPGTLPETVYFEVNQNQTATSASSGWVPLQILVAGVAGNVAVPPASTSQVYKEPCFSGSFRLKSSTNVGADRTFKCNKIWTT